MELLFSYYKNIHEVTVVCFGLTFKPDIDDLRESPALQITEKLAAKGYQILAVEPNVEVLPKSLTDLDNVTLVTLEEAMKQADAVGILVKHKEFLGMPVSNGNVLNFVNA